MDIVGERIKSLREGAGLSQAKVATILNTQQSAIFRYENNVSEMPYAMLLQYADYFDVSTDYLLGLSGIRGESPNKKKPIYIDGLSDNKKALLTFAETVPEDKAAMILQVMKSIVEAD